MVILIIALSVADYITTKKIIAAGGRELNPAMRWCIEKKLFAPAKCTLTAIAVISLIWGSQINATASLASGVIITTGYGAIIINNWRQLLR
jgi:hypothetical protein